MITLNVAAAEFLMNFGTHQIYLSFTDSDTVILQHKTETIHVSICPLLLNSQPAEIVTSGVEHSADILADARDFALDAFEVLPLLH